MTRELGLSAHRVSAASHLGVNVGDLLDRAALARDAVPRCDDAPVRALAELLDELVLGVDDKGLVESGEGMSCLLSHGVVVAEFSEMWCVRGRRQRRSRRL